MNSYLLIIFSMSTLFKRKLNKIYDIIIRLCNDLMRFNSNLYEIGSLDL